MLSIYMDLDSYNNTAYISFYGGYYNQEGLITVRKYSAQNTISATSLYARFTQAWLNLPGPATSPVIAQ